jgi:hypothetical protein
MVRSSIELLRSVQGLNSINKIIFAIRNMGQLLVATLCKNCKTNIQLINIGIGPHIDFVLLLCLL